MKKNLSFILLLTAGRLYGHTFGDSTLVVKQIIIEGNETTKDHVILREMSLKVGDPITEAALQQDRDRIYSLQLFNKVEIETARLESGARLIVRVYERWYLFPYPIFGIKYRDFNKIYYGAGVTHQNFRGRNEKVFLSFALGYDRWVSLVYQNPKLTDDDDIFFRGSVGYQEVHNLSVSNGEYQQENFSTNVTFGKRFGLYQSFQSWLNYESWVVSDPQIGRTASGTGRDAFFTIGMRYIYDSRNIREYPTEGAYVSLEANKAGFGESEVNLTYYGTDLRGYALATEDLTVGGRLFGATVGGGVAPPYRRVYFGYDERIRGYFHDILEGENILGGSVELRFPIFLPRYLEVSFIPVAQFSVLRYGLYGGIFADAGAIWWRGQAFSSVPWRTGYGGGLHFLLPYSIVVRTEFAVNNFGKGQFVLDFGVSF